MLGGIFYVFIGVVYIRAKRGTIEEGGGTYGFGSKRGTVQIRYNW